jgi:hypothetical protein
MINSPAKPKNGKISPSGKKSHFETDGSRAYCFHALKRLYLFFLDSNSRQFLDRLGLGHALSLQPRLGRLAACYVCAIITWRTAV